MEQSLDPPPCVYAESIFLFVKWAPKVHLCTRDKKYQTSFNIIKAFGSQQTANINLNGEKFNSTKIRNKIYLIWYSNFSIEQEGRKRRSSGYKMERKKLLSLFENDVTPQNFYHGYSKLINTFSNVARYLNNVKAMQ